MQMIHDDMLENILLKIQKKDIHTYKHSIRVMKELMKKAIQVEFKMKISIT